VVEEEEEEEPQREEDKGGSHALYLKMAGKSAMPGRSTGTAKRKTNRFAHSKY
jgi:hypothetical protein